MVDQWLWIISESCMRSKVRSLEDVNPSESWLTNPK